MTTTIPIHPDRLSHGEWKGGRLSGEGDVTASYSADHISENKPIRAPFEQGGSLWVCVSITGKGLTVSGETELRAYRLLPAEMFRGEPTTYAKKVTVDHGEAARNDPNGFYHGISVTHGGRTFIMCGPPGVFVAESVPERPGARPEPEQLGLGI